MFKLIAVAFVPTVTADAYGNLMVKDNPEYSSSCNATEALALCDGGVEGSDSLVKWCKDEWTFCQGGAIGFYDNRMGKDLSNRVNGTCGLSFQGWSEHLDWWKTHPDTPYCDYRVSVSSQKLKLNANVLCYDCGVSDLRARNIAVPFDDCKSLGLSLPQCMMRCSAEMTGCYMVMYNEKPTKASFPSTWQYFMHVPKRSISAVDQQYLKNLAGVVTLPGVCEGYQNAADCCRDQMMQWGPMSYPLPADNVIQTQVLCVPDGTQDVYTFGSTDIFSIPQAPVTVTIGTKNYGARKKNPASLKSSGTDDNPVCAPGDGARLCIVNDDKEYKLGDCKSSNVVHFVKSAGDGGLFVKDGQNCLAAANTNSNTINGIDSQQNSGQNCFTQVAQRLMKDTQTKSAGGYSSSASALSFTDPTDYNPSFSDQFPGVQGFFGIPECDEDADYYKTHPLQKTNDAAQFGLTWTLDALDTDNANPASVNAPAAGSVGPITVYQVGIAGPDSKSLDDEKHPCNVDVHTETKCVSVDVQAGMCDVSIDIKTRCTPCVWDMQKCEAQFDLACKYLSESECAQVRKTCSYMPQCYPPVPPSTKTLCQNECAQAPFACAFPQTKKQLNKDCAQYVSAANCVDDGGEYCLDAFDPSDNGTVLV